MKYLLRLLRRFISFSEAAYFALIYLGMHSVLLGVELVARGTSTEVLRILILLGILAGWLLSRSRLKFWLAALIGALVGFVLTGLHVGAVDAALKDLFVAGLRYSWGWVFQGSSDSTSLVLLLSVVQVRIQELATSLAAWGRDLVSGFTVYNQISTLISWGLILWIFSWWFSWTTYRKKQPIWGLIPAGVMLSILMTYTLEKRFTLVVLLGAGLVLIGLVNHDQKQREWKAIGVMGGDVIRERVYLAILGFALYTVAFAGLMPSIKIAPIADRFERLVYGSEEGQVTGEEGSSSIEVGGASSELYTIQRFAGLPRQKLIGSGPELAKRVVMVISYPTTSFLDEGLPSAGRYWRSYTYDTYTGVGWQSSPTEETRYQPGQEITSAFLDSMEIITQEVRLSNTVRGTLYSAGAPVTLDHEALVSRRTEEDGAEAGSLGAEAGDDIFAVTLDSILYQVRSIVPTATDDELRAAGGDYPGWVVSHYLALPDTVPQRVLDLAAQVTADQPTPYDKAKALESFLRTYPYTLELPAPPVDEDVADYFLFELQTGYCDYYATAMVVLARAVGLPARLVVGYVGGFYDPENDYYLVSEADAHTWVEIYFNGYGWIPFEPTASQSLLDDSQEPALPLPPELANLPQAAAVEGEGNFPWWEFGAGTLAAAAVLLWGLDRADRARLRGLETRRLILQIYHRVFRYGRWIEIGHSKTDTLYEFNVKLLDRMKALETGARGDRRMGEAAEEINQLTDLAVRANYSPQELGPSLNLTILSLWFSLRSKLRRVAWKKFWITLGARVFLGKYDRNRLQSIQDGAANGTR